MEIGADLEKLIMNERWRDTSDAGRVLMYFRAREYCFRFSTRIEIKVSCSSYF